MHPHYLCICLVFTRGILVYGWCCTYEVVWTFATLSRKTKKGKHRHLAAALISRCLQDATLRDTTIRDTTVRSRHTETHTLLLLTTRSTGPGFSSDHFLVVCNWVAMCYWLRKANIRLHAHCPRTFAHAAQTPGREDAKKPFSVGLSDMRSDRQLGQNAVVLDCAPMPSNCKPPFLLGQDGSAAAGRPKRNPNSY